ncbi:MAG: hypothetical protein SVR04_15005, partial [Spirochaetota bacterium]|nr:hypothetical protein [Spirochaetota bacterium]
RLVTLTRKLAECTSNTAEAEAPSLGRDVSSILELVLIIILVIYKEPLISLLGANLAEAALNSEAAVGADIVVIAINALLILMIVHIFFRAVRYAGVAARRRQLKQLFAGLEKKGYFHRSEAEAAVKTLFGNEKLFF